LRFIITFELSLHIYENSTQVSGQLEGNYFKEQDLPAKLDKFELNLNLSTQL
jgi:hypothetical protein